MPGPVFLVRKKSNRRRKKAVIFLFLFLGLQAVQIIKRCCKYNNDIINKLINYFHFKTGKVMSMMVF